VTKETLFRLGGLSAILGGALLILDVGPHLFVDDTLTPAELGGLPHELWHLPGIAALPLALLGLVAIYLAQSDTAGRLGLWGFVLLAIGMTVGAIYSTVFHGLFLPAIEGIEGGLFEELVDNTTAAQFYRGVLVQAFGLGLGAILLGTATIRSHILPALPGWALIVAALFAAANQVWAEGQLVSRALFGAAFVLFGVALRRTSQATNRMARP
jgi:hypothetical protein